MEKGLRSVNISKKTFRILIGCLECLKNSSHIPQVILKKRLNGSNTLDAEYNIFNENYTLENFEEDLKKRGYIKEDIDPDTDKSGNGTGKGKNILTAKVRICIARLCLKPDFWKT